VHVLPEVDLAGLDTDDPEAHARAGPRPEMGSHFFPDVLAILAVFGFGTTLSAASVLCVISAITLFPAYSLALWAGATAWMCTEATEPMQLPLQLLFTFAALQRCKNRQVFPGVGSEV
jgi:hypothetical protein